MNNLRKQVQDVLVKTGTSAGAEAGWLKRKQHISDLAAQAKELHNHTITKQDNTLRHYLGSAAQKLTEDDGMTMPTEHLGYAVDHQFQRYLHARVLHDRINTETSSKA